MASLRYGRGAKAPEGLKQSPENDLYWISKTVRREEWNSHPAERAGQCVGERMCLSPSDELESVNASSVRVTASETCKR